MIIKINTHKIEHQSNVEIFVWNYNNFIESKLKAKYEYKYKNNHILKDDIDKKKEEGKYLALLSYPTQ